MKDTKFDLSIKNKFCDPYKTMTIQFYLWKRVYDNKILPNFASPKMFIIRDSIVSTYKSMNKTTKEIFTTCINTGKHTQKIKTELIKKIIVNRFLNYVCSYSYVFNLKGI